MRAISVVLVKKFSVIASYFTILVSNLVFFCFFVFFTRCILSLSQAFFFKQYRINNIWSPPGIKPRTACIAHKRSASIV